MTDRQPPQDLAAEGSVLGAMLLSPDVIKPVMAVLGDHAGSVFYRMAHQTIYDTITRLYLADEPADAVTVAADLLRAGKLTRVGGAPYLHTLIASVPTAANAEFYAEIVAEKATLRRLVAAGTRIVQLGYQQVSGEDVDEVVTRARREVDAATRPGSTTELDGEATSLADLVCEPELPEDWVVPGLLERGDRMILTGFEGNGKSVLIGQIGLTIAGGLHPFTGEPLAPDGETQRVLILDVENTRRQLRRRLMRMAATVDSLRRGHGLDPVDWSTAVKVVIRPDGVDLAKPAEVARLDAHCLALSPTLMIAGPLYKMTGYNTHEEEGALKLLQTLDGIRVRHNLALISEHHAGHAQAGQTRSTRPIGSSVLLRWPEFGLGIARHPDGNPEEEHPTRVQVRRWRGSREERAWPRELLYGGRDRLPWIPPDEYRDELVQVTGSV